jgi:hypothetical protein
VQFVKSREPLQSGKALLVIPLGLECVELNI